MMRNRYLIAMAAGHGTRMGSALPKQFLDLGGIPVLRRTISTFLEASPGIKVVTVLPDDYIGWWKDYCLSSGFTCPQTILSGGITRFHSVRNALARVPDGAIVAIHDGVRPLLTPDLVRSMFSKMDSPSEDGSPRHALIPVTPSVDTLRPLSKSLLPDGRSILSAVPDEKIDRGRVFAVQTPQMFLSEDIKSAYAQAYSTSFTDDASVAEAKKIPLTFCEGERLNIKLTTPDDIRLAQAFLSLRLG